MLLMSCSLHELVKHEHNGLVFSSSKELATQVLDLLRDFPRATKQLDTMRENIKEFQQNRWDDNWKLFALPIFVHKKRGG
jgi:hypothetical protein